MNKDEIFEILYGKEKVDIYKKFQELEKEANNSSKLYEHFDSIKCMLLDDRSYIKLRGFRIICALSKCDKDNKIDESLDLLLNVLYDDKPTIVRQCMQCLPILIKNKANLSEKIKTGVKKIDYMKYKDSMSPLIKKDIENILDL